MKFVFLLAMLFLSFCSLSQAKDSLVIYTVLDSITLNVEFAKDSPFLDKIQEQKLVAFLDNAHERQSSKMVLTGHTDTDGSDEYNQRLSEQRANSVKAFIEKNRSNSVPVESQFFGEKKLLREELSDEDQQLNRRVELVAYFLVERQKTIPCATGRPRGCPDTLITLPSGIMYKIPTCDYYRNPNCVTLDEFITSRQIQEAGLNTMDVEGNTLFSAGMIKYNICDSLQIEVYIPVRESCFEEGMQLYEGSESSWVLSRRQDFSLEEVNRRRYYRIPVRGSGMVNMDKPGFTTPPGKIRFKSKRGVKLEQVALSCDCPMAAVFGPAKNKRKRTVALPRVCCSNPHVRVILTRKDGTTETLPYQPLSNLKRIRSIGGCKGREKWRFLFFRKRVKLIYRKYRVE